MENLKETDISIFLSEQPLSSVIALKSHAEIYWSLAFTPREWNHRAALDLVAPKNVTEFKVILNLWTQLCYLPLFLSTSLYNFCDYFFCLPDDCVLDGDECGLVEYSESYLSFFTVSFNPRMSAILYDLHRLFSELHDENLEDQSIFEMWRLIECNRKLLENVLFKAKRSLFNDRIKKCYHWQKYAINKYPPRSKYNALLYMCFTSPASIISF